ncbi:MAG: hypothetical protein A2172_03910 [Candidatus Woykebacteria bacterium RBG_13_40_15]|uniref:Uncharacterized protein n=1 Tax=Candidatus Woykebacteria bacterium RBG_13_40_15 TaxID=1802593 RepID=A0A1G1WA34_9BACT|nr:MAG: hypothetical protein A2172_03910 [Candidatus Woykebacteria bacterium RBG_13_40_15]
MSAKFKILVEGSHFPNLPEIGNTIISNTAAGIISTVIGGIILFLIGLKLGVYKRVSNAITESTSKAVERGFSKKEKKELVEEIGTLKLLIGEGEDIKKIAESQSTAYQSENFKPLKKRWELNVSTFLSQISPRYSLEAQYKAWSLVGTGPYKSTTDNLYWQRKYLNQISDSITILLSAKDQMEKILRSG